MYISASLSKLIWKCVMYFPSLRKIMNTLPLDYISVWDFIETKQYAVSRLVWLEVAVAGLALL